MIDAMIIDDEFSGRELLQSIIEKHHPEVILSPSAASVAEAIAGIDFHKPELIFLDIRLGKREGFEILQKTKFQGYHVIFVTAYNQFAIKAIKASAVDYLLKPIGVKDVSDALERYKDRKQQKVPTDKETLLALLAQSADGLKKKISIPSMQGHELVLADEVMYMIADKNYTEIYLKEGSRKIVTRSIGVFESQLPDFPFFRIHKSQIVNLNEVIMYVPGNGGTVKMRDGKRLEVSRRKKNELLQLLNIS